MTNYDKEFFENHYRVEGFDLIESDNNKYFFSIVFAGIRYNSVEYGSKRFAFFVLMHNKIIWEGLNE